MWEVAITVVGIVAIFLVVHWRSKSLQRAWATEATAKIHSCRVDDHGRHRVVLVHVETGRTYEGVGDGALQAYDRAYDKFHQATMWPGFKASAAPEYPPERP